MKLPKLFSLHIVITLSLLVEGCINASTILKTPSATNNSSVAPITTPNLTQTPTSSVLITLSPLATNLALPEDSARSELVKLLETNGNCHLPCLWGITPGKSTFQEAQSILEPLSSISDFTAFESNVGAIGLNYFENSIGIYTDLDFHADLSNNTVSSISFHAQALREINQGNYEELFGNPLYGQLLETYSLPRILATYGLATDVLIRTNSELPPQNWGPFEILLSYPERGFLVHYTIPMNPIGTNIVGCPEKSKLELNLVPSGNINSTDEFLALLSAPAKVEEIFSGYQPIEKVTSLSMDDFVKIFSEPTDKCIETPASYWPAP